MTTSAAKSYLLVLSLMVFSCNGKKQQQFENVSGSISLRQGEIALCGSQEGEFGAVDFDISCLDKVKEDFRLATALLHSFEYVEAEKVFAQVLEKDPECVMAYWGVAMSNYHSLWALQDKPDLKKGHKTVALARSIDRKTERESDYLEAIGAFYDDWDQLDHRTRSLRFEKAMENMYNKYPTEKEAAVFYALALNATADPTDKTFSKQQKAGRILSSIYPDSPNHPGIAHYLIHTYDYPELATLALPAARAYASIAPASAHAQHMPSHIFTRLGIWQESVHANLNSISAAQCYADNIGMKGRLDEELHGMDYLVYAYLQRGQDSKAREQLELLQSFDELSSLNGKVAYVFAAIPARYALERKQWSEATQLQPFPSDFPWDQFPWENAITHFARLLGFVHTHDLEQAGKELAILTSLQKKLTDAQETYKAQQVAIQIQAGEAWIRSLQGNKRDAIQMMTAAADMEEATAKHPVTPGEVVPARELLGDMLMETDETEKALEAYELSLQRLPNRFNSLYGAGLSAQKSENFEKAENYFRQLMQIASMEECNRPEISHASTFAARKK